MMGLSHDTPVTPTPLLLAAAATPAVAVPCPSTSAVLLFERRKLQPGMSLAARSGCPGLTPESIMAIGTLALPVVISHAAGALIVLRCHCDENPGSLGMLPLL